MIRFPLACLCILALALTPAITAAQTPTVTIEGAWEAQSYHLAGGELHALRGRIFFTASECLVLFFVMDGEVVKRGSGEGGSYVLTGDR